MGVGAMLRRLVLAKALEERGQGLVVGALAMVVILGFAALAVDAGAYMHERRELQKGADAAALAAASELDGSSCGPCAARQAAMDYVELNGVDPADPETTVEVTTPYEGDPSKVEVTISEEVDFLFAPVLGIDGAGVEARAVAELSGSGSGNYAILVLNETACPAYKQSGSANLTIEDGGIMVNSNCSNAFKKTGSGDITADVIHYFYEGGYQISGSGDVTPEPSPVTERVEDPLADWEPPEPGDPAPGSEGTADDPQLTHLMGSGDRTVYPGTYYGGLKISGSGDTTFEPGIYIMAGGGLELSGSGDYIGEDVMFYNTNDPDHPTGAGDYDGIKITGSGSLIFTAPADEPYPGMLFWQDPANTEDFDKAGSGNITEGIFYLPSAKLDVSGSGNIGAVQFIVDQFEKTGSGNLTLTAGDYIDTDGPASVRLIE
jgi:Flp pilus assembly protein TadG